jgi:hypothetical protein
MELRTKFRGNSSEVYVTGKNTLILKKYQDKFSWDHLDTCAHNVIVGAMWIDHFGTIHLRNHTTGDFANVKFNRAGWLGSGRWEFSGDISNNQGTPTLRVHGKWNGAVYITKLDEKGKPVGEATLIWEKEVPGYQNKWNFPSKFSESLNGKYESSQ